MLTRLTLTILDYAVNDASQFSKRTKTVELYLDKYETPVNSDSNNAVKHITAVIPIDQPSEAVAYLDTYAEFLLRFGVGMADRLQQRAKELKVKQNDIDSLVYWQGLKGLNLDKFVAGITDKERADELRKAAAFVQEHNIVPGRVPKDDQFLRGPAAYERKGSASAGLQSLDERLKAASPSK